MNNNTSLMKHIKYHYEHRERHYEIGRWCTVNCYSKGAPGYAGSDYYWWAVEKVNNYAISYRFETYKTLKQMCRDNNIKGWYKLKKNEMIKALLMIDSPIEIKRPTIKPRSIINGYNKYESSKYHYVESIEE